MIETYCSSHFSASSMYANSSALHQLVTCSSCWALHVLIQKSRVHTASLRRSVLPAVSQYAGYAFVFRCDAPKHICLRHLFAYFSHRRKPSTDKMFFFFFSSEERHTTSARTHDAVRSVAFVRLRSTPPRQVLRRFRGHPPSPLRRRHHDLLIWRLNFLTDGRLARQTKPKHPASANRTPLPTPSILTASPLHTCCLLP